MGAEVDQDYAFEERAVVREFDAFYPRERAEQLAAADMIERKGQQKIYEQYQARNSIKSLREKRDLIGKQMRAETDPELKDKLFGEWQDLFQQIIKLRKESENGNGRRLSG